MKFHGHTPVWWLYNPQWFINIPDHREAHPIMVENLEWITDKWKNNLYSLDVVNEVMDSGGYPRGKYAAGWRMRYPSGDGRGYAYWAMGCVKKKAPNVRRVYNGVFIHQMERDMVLDMARRGFIEAVGYQCHWNAGDEWLVAKRDKAWIRDIVRSGTEFYFSEVGVRHGTVNQRCKTWNTLAKFAIDEGVKRFVVWGVKDGTESYRYNATLYNTSGKPKTEYYRLRDYLRTL
jgi:GH35 family endo-1,4-beta-xylanase